MEDEWVHLIVKRLSPECVHRGVINVDGLTDKEFDQVVAVCEECIAHLRFEIDAGRELRKRRGNVIPFPSK